MAKIRKILAVILAVVMVASLTGITALAGHGSGGNERPGGENGTYDSTQTFGWDAYTSGGSTTGVSVKIGGSDISANSASSTTGTAVAGGVQLTFAPGYYLVKYKIVCGDKYGCQTDASGNVPTVNVGQDASTSGYTVSVASSDCAHTSNKEPYWLLLDIGYNQVTTYNVTYSWGTLSDMTAAAPDDSTDYLINANATALAPSDAAISEADALGYTFAGWVVTGTGYGSTVYASGNSLLVTGNLTLTAQWTEKSVPTPPTVDDTIPVRFYLEGISDGPQNPYTDAYATLPAYSTYANVGTIDSGAAKASFDSESIGTKFATGDAAVKTWLSSNKLTSPVNMTGVATTLQSLITAGYITGDTKVCGSLTAAEIIADPDDYEVVYSNVQYCNDGLSAYISGNHHEYIGYAGGGQYSYHVHLQIREKPATLTITKTVSGFSTLPSNYSVTITYGTDYNSETGTVTGTDVTFDADDFTKSGDNYVASTSVSVAANTYYAKETASIGSSAFIAETADSEVKSAAITAGGTGTVAFTNAYSDIAPTVLTGSITISKAIGAVNEYSGASSKAYTFNVTGPDDYTNSVTITGTGSKTIIGLAAGTYTFTEADANVAHYSLSTGTDKANNANTVTIVNGNVNANNQIQVSSGSITFTNTYTEDAKYSYSVTYYDGYTSAAGQDDSQNKTNTYTAPDYVIDVDANTFTRANYTFAGWSETVDGDVVYNAGESITFTASGHKDLYAVWTENSKYSFALTYNGNGGALTGSETSYGDAENQNNTYATSLKVSVDGNTFVREGYTFAGWATSSDAEASNVAAGSDVTLDIANPVKTLYALWIRDTGTLTIKKAVTGSQVTVPADATFSVYADGSTTASYTFKYSDMKNGSYTISVPTASYTVTESGANVGGYDLATVYGDAAAVTKGGTATLTVTNNYTLVNVSPVVPNFYYRINYIYTGYDENGNVIYSDTVTGSVSTTTSSTYSFSAGATASHGGYDFDIVGDVARSASLAGTSSANPYVFTVNYEFTNINDGDTPLDPAPGGDTEIPDEEVPLGPADGGEEVDIPDEDVALDDSPKTGDSSLSLAALWTLFIMSGAGLGAIVVSFKKSKKSGK